jgi:aspartate 1-decarboxylase
MLKHFVSAKIHGIVVTGKSLDYRGSATIPKGLMDAAGIAPFEKVQVVNKANGNRWETYAIVGPPGVFTLNGAAARQGEVGDECLVICYRIEGRFSGAKVAFVGPGNGIDRVASYDQDAENYEP